MAELDRDNCSTCAVEDNSRPSSVRTTNRARSLVLMQAGMTMREVLFGAMVEAAQVMRDLDDPTFTDDESQEALKNNLREKVGITKGLKMATEALSLMRDPHNKTSLVDRSRVLEPFTLIPHQTVEQALVKTGISTIASSILFSRASAAYMAAFNKGGAESF